MIEVKAAKPRANKANEVSRANKAKVNKAEVSRTNKAEVSRTNKAEASKTNKAEASRANRARVSTVAKLNGVNFRATQATQTAKAGGPKESRALSPERQY